MCHPVNNAEVFLRDIHSNSVKIIREAEVIVVAGVDSNVLMSA